MCKFRGVFTGVLVSFQAKPRHMKCIGVAAFYLAAKIKEEDNVSWISALLQLPPTVFLSKSPFFFSLSQVIPGTLELVRVSKCGCSQAEILRMERCILDKLGWDLALVTPLDFLHIFHALLFINVPHLLDNCGHMTPARQLSLVTAKLERCVSSHTSLLHAPSTLALALLSLELELFCPNWLSITFTLQKMVQVSDPLAPLLSVSASLFDCEVSDDHVYHHCMQKLSLFHCSQTRDAEMFASEYYEAICQLLNIWPSAGLSADIL